MARFGGDWCYPATVTKAAASFPARYASMVSELSIAAPRNDFPGGDLNPWRSTLGSSNRSRWWSDQGDSGNSNNFGVGFRHRRSNLGTRSPTECDFKLQSDSRRSTFYDDNFEEAINLCFDSFEEKLDRHHRELMELLESLCRGHHRPTRNEWSITDEGAPPSSLSRTPVVRQNFQVTISNPTPANSRNSRKGGGNNTVISTVSVDSYSPKEEENMLGNYDDLSDDYEPDEDDFMEESDFEELAEILGGDTGVDKGDEVVFEGGVQRIANEEKQQIELSVIWDDDEEEYNFCNDDVEEVRIEKDVRRKAEEKKDKPKSVVLDEPCAVLDDVDDEDAVAIAQLPQGEPVLGVLDCVWGKSRCFSETPNPNLVLQQNIIVLIVMANPRPKKTTRALQPAESILRRLVSSTSKSNPILNLGQASNGSLNQRPVDYDIGWKFVPGSGAVKALQVALLGEVFDPGGTVDNVAAVKFETSEFETTESLCQFMEEGWDAEEIHAVGSTLAAAAASGVDVAVGNEFTVAADKKPSSTQKLRYTSSLCSGVISTSFIDFEVVGSRIDFANFLKMKHTSCKPPELRPLSTGSLSALSLTIMSHGSDMLKTRVHFMVFVMKLVNVCVSVIEKGKGRLPVCLVMRVAVQREVASDLPKLVECLKIMAKSEPPAPFFLSVLTSVSVVKRESWTSPAIKRGFNQGKRRINSRASMAQRDDMTRMTVYVYDIDPQVTEEQLAARLLIIFPTSWPRYHDTAWINYWTCSKFAQKTQVNVVHGFYQQLALMCWAPGMNFALKTLFAVLKPQNKEHDLQVAILLDDRESESGDPALLNILVAPLNGLMQGKSDKVIQGRALCAGIFDTLGKSTPDMMMCVANTELIRSWKKMILALSALCPILMIYTTRAESPQPADSSVVDKRVQVFDPGCEAKELPSIQIALGNQPWVDKAELSENAVGLAGVVSAGQKHEMLKSLQGRNHIWEIVGNGVDNARALKRTIIGVAVADDLGAARSTVEIADTLSVLAATPMLCETNAKPGKSSDTSIEEKIMMTFDLGGEAPDVSYFSSSMPIQSAPEEQTLGQLNEGCVEKRGAPIYRKVW